MLIDYSVAELVGTSQGLVSFATLLTMLATNQWRLQHDARNLVQLMVYLDCLAFVPFYLSLYYSTLSPSDSYGCTLVWLNWMSDVLWSLKDCFRTAFIARKILVLTTRWSLQMQCTGYLMCGATSYAIQQYLISTIYDLSSTCTLADAIVPSMYTLQVYWLLVWSTAGVVLLLIMTGRIYPQAKVEAPTETMGLFVEGTSPFGHAESHSALTPEHSTVETKREHMQLFGACALSVLVYALVFADLATQSDLGGYASILLALAQNIILLSEIRQQPPEASSEAMQAPPKINSTPEIQPF
ncbi:uncharacterized protein BJ171DRAFT_81067 [Polychytrium aggregatum]|uniref:uncharacterized protein n=1 Tax=Polychytrium aggregatum TaxID=110093 RepID=UPI0022FF15E7|nr:uncharacterized protein BJ171DRAFT_81067 [Polychytrium aggregatum]KAI9204984.1 hypothetical protein BJ171DRAFT_81067 [Polychytrium aggregatum]